MSLRVLRLPWASLLTGALVTALAATAVGTALMLGEGGESPLSTLLLAGAERIGARSPSWLADGSVGAAVLLSAVVVAAGAFVTARLLGAWERDRLVVLVRALGASRTTVAGTDLLQALAVGVVGALVGLAGSLALAPVLDGLSDRGAPAGLSVRSALLTVAVGVLVAVLGVLPTARREAATPASHALSRSRPGRRRTESALRPVSGGGLLLLAAGAVAVTLAWLVDVPRRQTVLGAGASLLCVGLLGALPVLVTAVARLIGWLPRALVRPAGRLAVRALAAMPRRAGAAGLLIAVGSLAAVATATAQTSERTPASPAAHALLASPADAARPTIVVVLAVVTVASLVCLAATAATTVPARRDSFTLVAAVGATRTVLALQVVIECLLVSVSAAVVGSAAGLLLGSAVPAVSAPVPGVAVPWSALGWVLATAAALGLLGAVWPVRRALRITKPTEENAPSDRAPAGSERWDVQ